MVAPRVVPRAEHTISRRDIDPDALKVLYRLRHFNYTAYLVGGSVRDLSIGRHPKDFDIGTSAHPSQVKKLFRNCWIIGRRFRLAHVKFGNKVIEVATFRRQVAPGEETLLEPIEPGAGEERPAAAETDHYIHHDNTFGTPEEDAFRRDFTINALFYDIATFSIIDYVGGLEDLRAGVVRCIGDPEVRFREDPVRMMRAVALAARLDFTIDPQSLSAIKIHRHEIARSSPPRLLEEYYKILRAGAAERTFRDLARLGLLEPISAELHLGAASLWQSLAAIDAYRRRFNSAPDTLTNAILAGSLLVPMGLMNGRTQDLRGTDRARREHESSGRHAARSAALEANDVPENDRQAESEATTRTRRPRRPEGPRLGQLPLARRDIERLRQLLGLQRRMLDLAAAPRAKRALTHRSVFREALTWLDIHGNAPEAVAHWTALAADGGPSPDPTSDPTAEPSVEGVHDAARPARRRRRRGRRRVHPAD